MMRIRLASCSTLVCAVTVAGCGLPTDGDGLGEETVAERSAIVRGSEVSMTDSEQSGIALLVNRDTGKAFCTGTLFNQSWLITASHCFPANEGDPDGTISANHLPKYAVHFGNNTVAGDAGPFNPTFRSVNKIISHPGSPGFGVDAFGFPRGFDVTLVKLSSAAPSSALSAAHYPNGRMRIYSGTNASIVGKTLTVYGYGKNEGLNGQAPWDSIGILRYGWLSASRAVERFLTLYSPYGDGTYVLNNGDSGGPSFLDTYADSIWTRQMVGVHSTGSGDEGERSVATDTHAEFFKDFITTVIDEGEHPVGDPYYVPGYGWKFRLQHSRKCLTVSGGSTQSGAPVVQSTCQGGLNQRVNLIQSNDGYESAVFAHSGQCMEVKDGSVSNGAAIVQRPCTGAARQLFKRETWWPDGLWMMAGRTRLRWKHSSKCADINGASTSNGAGLIQYSCHVNANQQITFLK